MLTDVERRIIELVREIRLGQSGFGALQVTVQDRRVTSISKTENRREPWGEQS